jgi:hypothetical protein
LLAKALTDPRTREEWERTSDSSGYGLGEVTLYTNATRNIVVKRWWAGGFGTFSSGIKTPFTLNKDEEKVVRDALTAFDNRLREEAEQAALRRLVCCEPTKKGRGK